MITIYISNFNLVPNLKILNFESPIEIIESLDYRSSRNNFVLNQLNETHEIAGPCEINDDTRA